MSFSFKDQNPYIIAEIGVNHEGSLDKAKMLIDLVKEGGAHAAKFQSYKADTIASINSPAYWSEDVNPVRSQHELFKKYDNFTRDDYYELAEYCSNGGIYFASTPFDDDSIDFLESIVPFYKIASADITNHPFIEKIAKKNKPIILSTGASNLKEIEESLNIIKKHNNQELCLMHCILSYPTVNDDANLNMIEGLKQKFNDVIIGYSDHTKPDSNMLILTTAFIKGAQVIEKHFTFDKCLPGNDHFHAMNIDDLKKLNSNLKLINQINGIKSKKPIKSELIAREHARRSIVVKEDIKKGDEFVENMLTYKRPGNGISPKNWKQVLGKKSNKDLLRDHILAWEDLE